MEKLSVITAVHNQIEYNKLFYDSLMANTFHPFKLIIVDNNSTDGSREFFREKNCEVVVNSENLSYSVSQNCGIKHADTKYLAFLNNDICLSKHWDRKLIEYLDAYRLDVISPCGIENLETNHTTNMMMLKWRYVNFFQRVRISLDIPYTREMLEKMVHRMYGNWERFTGKRAKCFENFLYPGIMGNAIVTRKAVFDTVGSWNEDVAASDWELALRLVKNQIEKGDVMGPVIAGDVFVHHFIRATFRKNKAGSSKWNSLKSVSEVYHEKDLRYLNWPKVSIIIAVYNKANFLEKILLSLLKQSLIDFEIVIADDGSGKEIKNIIDTYSDKFRYPIQHARQKDRGFRKTVIANRAVSLARSKYILFIDGDCILHHRFVERHYKRRRIHTVLAGRRVNLKRELSDRLSHDDITSGRLESQDFLIKGAEKTTRKFSNYRPWLFLFKNLRIKNYEIVGCNYSLYKGDYYRVNGYDERVIGRGLEDNNLCNRLKKANIKIRYISNEALQYHLFHSFDPVPHDKEVIKNFGNPGYGWTPYGIVKTESVIR